MTARHRFRLAATALVATTALTLASCGSDDKDKGGAGAGGESTSAQKKEPNKRVDRAPRFDGGQTRYAAVENEGCGAGFTDWAKDVIVYFTDVNGGNWEYVDVQFDNGPTSPLGHKTCQIKVSDAQVTAPKEGEFNNATITVMALQGASNAGDEATAKGFTKYIKQQTDNGGKPLSDVTIIDKSSATTSDALAYAQANGLTADAHVDVEPTKAVARMFATGSPNKALITEFDQNTSKGGVGGAWVLVESDDPQGDNPTYSYRNVIGRLAETMSETMNASANEATYEAK